MLIYSDALDPTNVSLLMTSQQFEELQLFSEALKKANRFKDELQQIRDDI